MSKSKIQKIIENLDLYWLCTDAAARGATVREAQKLSRSLFRQIEQLAYGQKSGKKNRTSSKGVKNG